MNINSEADEGGHKRPTFWCDFDTNVALAAGEGKGRLLPLFESCPLKEVGVNASTIEYNPGCLSNDFLGGSGVTLSSKECR